MPKYKFKSFRFTEQMVEKLNDIIKHEGWQSDISAIISCINLKHSKLFPNYAIIRGKSVDETPEREAERKTDVKMHEQKIKENKKLKEKQFICTEILKGYLEDDGNICVFETHNTKESFIQKMPIMQADESILNTLFTPTKEIVLEARPELAEIYE